MNILDPVTIVEAPLRTLYDWWAAASAEPHYPERSAFDPGEHRPILANLTLVDTAPRLEDFRIRVYGSVPSEVFQQDRTGKTFAEIELQDEPDFVLAGYWQVYCEGAPHYLSDRSISFSREYIGFSRLLLPLGPTDDAGRPSFIIGAFDFSSKIR